MSTITEEKTKNKAFGNRVKTLRKARKLTQEACANCTSVSLRHYQKIEAGEINPPLGYLNKLSETLAVKPCYLLENIEIETNDQPPVFCAVELFDIMTFPFFAMNENGSLVFKNQAFKNLGITNKTASAFLEIPNSNLEATSRIEAAGKNWLVNWSYSQNLWIGFMTPVS